MKKLIVLCLLCSCQDDKESHKVKVGEVIQEVTVYSLSKNLNTIETELWSGSKKKSYTLEYWTIVEVSREEVDSVKKAEYAKAMTARMKCDSVLNKCPQYN